MCGGDEQSEGMFSHLPLERQVPSDHPLRAIRGLVEEVLEGPSAKFSKLYSRTGRLSIPPKYLLTASLLQEFFTIRSERQVMEQIDYNLLIRWFVGLAMDDQVLDPKAGPTITRFERPYKG